MNTVYIAGFRRSIIGRYGGLLSEFRPDDMAADVIRHLLAAHPFLDPSWVDDVILGCANQAGEDNRNIARFAGLLAGLPVEVPGVTVNRLCASGMQSVIDAYARIGAGLADVIIAGGVESMSRAPYVMPKPSKALDRSLQIADTTLGARMINPVFADKYYPYSMGETAENIAERWHISRESQDVFADDSHRKYLAAHRAGHYERELVPVGTMQEGRALRDENARVDTSIEKLAKLKPLFRNPGTVTAGNASGLNDGASALLVVSEQALKDYDLQPIARIVTAAVAGVHPDIMGTGPVPATRKALKQAGLSIGDLGLIEINEAYAVQVLYCMEELGLDPGKVNVDGGALAIGHPLGCSGNRITGHLALALQREQHRYGLATMCVGVGQGSAIIIENTSNQTI